MNKYTIDLKSKRVIKNTSARGTRYKVFCNGHFYGWLKRKHYNELIKLQDDAYCCPNTRAIFDEYGNAV